MRSNNAPAPCAASTASTRGRSACCARPTSTAPIRWARCACSTRSHMASAPTASDIGRALDLDAGYLCRVLRKFEKRGLITRKTSRRDARQSHLALTARGRQAFAPVEKRSQRDVGDMLGKLKPDEQAQLVAAMQTIETLLDKKPDADKAKPAYMLRAPRHGDFGWIVSRHAAALCAGIRLGRAVRGPVRADRRRFRQQLRCQARTLLDRRDGRRERRLRHAGEGLGRGGAAAPAAGRPEGARLRARPAAGRRMRRLRARRPATRR